MKNRSNSKWPEGTIWPNGTDSPFVPKELSEDLHINSIEEIIESVGLKNRRKKLILFNRLVEIFSRLDTHMTRASRPSNAAVLDHIAKIENLANKAAKLAGKAAKHRLASGRFWRVLSNDHGNIPTKMRYIGETFDSWFVYAETIKDICVAIRKNPEIRSVYESDEQADIGKAELIGHELPALYTELTANPFKISKSDNKTVSKGGVLFVQLCYRHMGLGEISASTVEVHWDKIRRKKFVEPAIRS